MKTFECRNCGSSEFFEAGGYLNCAYCKSKFVPEEGDLPRRRSVIAVDSDVESLLDKCRNDPANRRRYASLVLDLDPTNKEALRFIQ